MKYVRTYLIQFITILSILASASVARTAVVDIMIVYELGAKAWVDINGGMSAFSNDVVNRMNQALKNSDINDHTFRLVHDMEVNYTNTELSPSLTALISNSGSFEAVHTARDTYGADLVAMLIDTGSATGTIGLGYVLNNWSGSPNYGFTTNAIRAVAEGHTVTHEVGHNLGADHSKFQTSSPGPSPLSGASYAAGWYFNGSGTNYHTIMAYNFDGYGNFYTAAPLFSTPLVTYNGALAGDAADGDNTRLLRQTIPIVADYRPTKVPTSELCSSVLLSLSSTEFSSAGGDITINVTTPIENCSWEVLESSDWITASPVVGLGSDSLTISADINIAFSDRNSTILIGDKEFQVTQQACDTLYSGQGVSVTVGLNEQKCFQLSVPEGSDTASVILDNLTADLDLYVQYNGMPDINGDNNSCVPYAGGTSSETCPTGSPANPTTGSWGIIVHGYAAGSGALTATISPEPKVNNVNLAPILFLLLNDN